MKANKLLVITLVALAVTSSLLVAVLILFFRSHRDTVLNSSVQDSRPSERMNTNWYGFDPVAPAVLLAERGSTASWSPDGRQVLFKDQGFIHLLDLPTRTTRSLEIAGGHPVWSPSGALLACVRQGSYATNDSYLSEEVWVAPMKEGPARRLIRGGFPSWSVDGRTLYVHSRADHQLLALDANDLDAPPTVFYDKTPSYYFSVAPDGRQIAFGSRNQLDIRDRTTRTVVRQWPTPGHRGLLPAWSPDGALVAFGGFNGTQLGVWVLQLSTGRAVPVKEGRFTMPVWSADGRWLAFDERASGGRNSIWLVGRPHLQQLLEATPGPDQRSQ
jgi:Tol biopolymer transport system component